MHPSVMSIEWHFGCTRQRNTRVSLSTNDTTHMNINLIEMRDVSLNHPQMDTSWLTWIPRGAKKCGIEMISSVPTVSLSNIRIMLNWTVIDCWAYTNYTCPFMCSGEMCLIIRLKFGIWVLLGNWPNTLNWCMDLCGGDNTDIGIVAPI